MQLHFDTAIPLSLYIHMPWCVKKCPYCDFNSHEMKDPIDEARYIDALIQDLTQELPAVWGRKLSSIFIGGGTPSLISAEGYEKLFSTMRSLIPFQPDMEITLEANPGTFDANNFAGYRELGINRLSIGVQSFNNEQLQVLGRIHSSDQALQAIEHAKRIGFDNFNIDLMHGLPDQTLLAALADIKTAIQCEPTHISWYQLTLEPNTAFYNQPPTLPEEDILIDIQDQGEALLKSAGFDRYEISAFAKPGKASFHNMNYWEFGDYLGIGAGAHQKLTNMQYQTVTRRHKFRHPKDYMNMSKGFVSGEKVLTAQELPLEFMMNAMRLMDGVPRALFAQRSGLMIENILPAIEKAQQKGLLEESWQQLKPTPQGYRFLNDLLENFMTEQLQHHQSPKIIPIKPG
ncbi:MAG: radical SAM family heme chaperone HemW [Pseudomonadota bacterium]